MKLADLDYCYFYSCFLVYINVQDTHQTLGYPIARHAQKDILQIVWQISRLQWLIWMKIFYILIFTVDEELVKWWWWWWWCISPDRCQSNIFDYICSTNLVGQSISTGQQNIIKHIINLLILTTAVLWKESWSDLWVLIYRSSSIMLKLRDDVTTNTVGCVIIILTCFHSLIFH